MCHRYGFDARDASFSNKSYQKESYISSLQSCLKLRDFTRVENLHAEICRENPSLLQVMVNYANSGSLERADNVFENITLRDEVIWASFMEALNEHVW